MDFNDEFFNDLKPKNFVSKLTQLDEEHPGITFVKHFNLIPPLNEYKCLSTTGCYGSMKIIHQKTSKFDYVYRCNRCMTKISPGKDTWFDSSRLSLIDNLYLVFLWCSEINNKKMKDYTGHSKQTICDHKKKLRELMISHWINNQDVIGGEDKIVEIDESIIFKRKNNVGRVLSGEINGSWVVGGVERGSKKCFAQMVKKRDKSTLNNLISRWVEPKTIVMTDKWGGYLDLDSLGYIHKSVNHSQNFVDPDDRTQ